MHDPGGATIREVRDTVVDLADPGPVPVGPPMAVLVVGTDDWAVEQACNTLTAAGHRVFTCHDLGAPGPGFPCRALVAGDRCPLAAGAQLVLDIRSRPLPTPSYPETGVICGLRDGLPLVTGGVSVNNPFTPWAAVEVEPGGDLVEACVKAHEVSKRKDIAGSRG
ncbi:MAG TPA: hypothetical protein VFP54_01570 [Acidimicrobiales bacterium]|nr:hypothetical protein [Acidimicrobiales bacterium]